MAAAAFFAVNTFIFCKVSVTGDYMIINGICQGSGFTAVKKRTKHIVLQADGRKVQVAVNKRFKAIPAGTPVMLYISKNTPVYEINGTYYLYSFMAIDFQTDHQKINNIIIDERCQK